MKIHIFTRRREELDELRAEVAVLRRDLEGVLADLALREAFDRVRRTHGGEP
ncbi:MAG TPA: hypothetical protein VGX25_00640 [Actinophytocola sp.]|uniref:hypothetical protein n=1 Tax=Actinophytocola sp. TaxID=1872138 RepID=UPI002DDD0E01|nr:hypothetical protein [Actinophytocola sp.]HEV2777886.1 hypothetical protein [Actinophytocola sp.]